jgi:lipid-A-disaccharide synthase
MPKIYLIAGEASGDNIGAKLMKAIRKISPDVKFYGIGGEKMTSQGMKLLFSTQELAVMGFWEILPYIPKFLYLINKTAIDIVKVNPDVVITIDSPGFCFRVADSVKTQFKGKLMHYVAPTVWAYKPERAGKIAKIYDHLLVILPFESEYFTKEGLPTSFVGHPAIEDLAKNKNNFRERHYIAEDDLLLCLTPGSRKQEIKALLPIFLEAITLLQNKLKKKIYIAIPCRENLKPIIENYVKNYQSNVIIIDEANKQDLFSSCDLALSKSGTITTELAFYQMPMVVAHKINPISFWFLKRMIKIKYASIINILADKELIPELLQDKCNPLEIANALHKLTLKKNSVKWQKEIKTQLNKLKIKDKLPSDLAAEKALSLITRK